MEKRTTAKGKSEQVAYPKLEVIRRQNGRGIFPFGVSTFLGRVMPAFTCGISAFHMKGGAIKSHATMVVSKLRAFGIHGLTSHVMSPWRMRVGVRRSRCSKWTVKQRRKQSRVGLS
jgi:hypothetical protein